MGGRWDVTGVRRVGCCSITGSCPPAHARQAGFSIIDVLVSISVIAVLLSILAPSLAGVRETTRRVICSSNIRQLGLGLAMYQDMYRDALPDSYYATKLDNPHANPQEMMTLRRTDFHEWEGLGHLYANDFLDASGVFYCPSHHGHYPAARFSEAWISGVGRIVSNFHYRGPPIRASRTSTAGAPTNALIADGMATRLDFNHTVGTNVLRQDLSVHWYADTNRSLFLSLPEELEGGAAGDIPGAWETLDGGIN